MAKDSCLHCEYIGVERVNFNVFNTLLCDKYALAVSWFVPFNNFLRETNT